MPTHMTMMRPPTELEIKFYNEKLQPILMEIEANAHKEEPPPGLLQKIKNLERLLGDIGYLATPVGVLMRCEPDPLEQNNPKELVDLVETKWAGFMEKMKLAELPVPPAAPEAEKSEVEKPETKEPPANE